MVYDPATDFLGLWRNNGGSVSKLEMPGLDYVVAALARAGVISLSVSATPPVVAQDVTAWLQAAVPSYSAEGDLFLWDEDAAAYAPATPALFFRMLQVSAGQSGVSWYATTGGPPANVVGLDGDFAIQTDGVGGIYGPKALGAWPADPLPGTTDIISSTQLDVTFGTVPGTMIYRGVATWDALAVGAANQVLRSTGTAPDWEALSSLLDTLFGSFQGSILYRDAGVWDALGPGLVNQVLATNGPGANPTWTARTPEFASGTVMLFRQTAAPTGWTKSITFNDYGLRVTSGAVGSIAGTAFSTVFAQTAVGNTTLTMAQMPVHDHDVFAVSGAGGAPIGSASPGFAGPSTITSDAKGSGSAHTHSVQLALSYVDVIIATKD